ncbi:3-oxoacyl-[acyl-carrier-protein] synthase III C-terminal domain-containing protein [Paenibacillus polymyxa]|uniref:Beta-ketoacyl-[acyl-carrier-protein] synthase III n=1 Tax=Paenibacillus polymyxa (strain SC2) TaxID=886882 RepID=E3EL31_PAEPS|nr:3-oxoacyl-[acyl-carrier-protein] synthase III C-terminal domain-containing protein [Paenibacillus polymyxa]ADO59593.2 hypothetical protein PPSC2_27155 [Paenibacillus polymyxa SC2]WPQ59579.1 3-oxoacyl-[acyl-carrier-protein] synthase III C-terminal domain-containing protein [Paenibacillus polymyxa]
MSVIIKNTAIYHPKHRIGNEELINEFKKYGKDIDHFLEAIGRKNRYMDPTGTETSVTMAIQATIALLDKEKLRGEDIDIIVFSSGTPEYTIPANAMFVHRAIGGKAHCTVYDMNANCVGMVVAMEQVIRSMQGNRKMKRAIIVGSERMAQYSKKTDEVNRGVYGDGACAVLLESIDDETRGFIDSFYHTDTSVADQLLFPAKGLSEAIKGERLLEEHFIFMVPGYQALRLAPQTKELMEEMLIRNGITKKDVRRYFISQVSVKGGTLFSQLLEEDVDKFVYIGDEFGYTGTSSPLFALNHAFENNLLNKGDAFILWSVGAGQTSCGTLFRL